MTRDWLIVSTPSSLAIIDAVASFAGMTVDVLLGPNRHADVARYRQLAMWLCRTVTGLSYPQIAYLFRRDHTTVMYACRKVSGKLGNREPSHVWAEICAFNASDVAA